MIALRPYQLDAVERVRVALRGGSRRILIALPTGGGKTVIAAHLITQSVARGKRVLFIAHRRELIQQCYRKLLEAGIAEREIGVLMSGDSRRRPGAAVQVASIDTLRHRAKPVAELVIIDEAHRALAKSYRDIAGVYPFAVHLGLSATPYRADGRGLGDAYDDLVVVATAAELIAEGFLVEPRVFTVSASDLPDLSSVRVRAAITTSALSRPPSTSSRSSVTSSSTGSAWPTAGARSPLRSRSSTRVTSPSASAKRASPRSTSMEGRRLSSVTRSCGDSNAARRASCRTAASSARAGTSRR